MTYIQNRSILTYIRRHICTLYTHIGSDTKTLKELPNPNQLNHEFQYLLLFIYITLDIHRNYIAIVIYCVVY